MALGPRLLLPTHSRTLRGWLAGWLAISIAIAISTYRSIDTVQHSSLHRTGFPPSAACLACLCQPHANWAEGARNSQQQKNLTMPRCPTYRVLLSENLPPWPRYTCHIRARRRNVSDVVGCPASHFWQGTLLGACSLSRERPKKRRRSRRRKYSRKTKTS